MSYNIKDIIKNTVKHFIEKACDLFTSFGYIVYADNIATWKIILVKLPSQ